jgi:fucose permease
MKLFDNKTQRKQFALSYGVFLMNGMLALSIGSLLPFIRDARGLEYAFCGMIVSLHSVGNLVASFVAGALPIVIGKKKSILIFEAFFAISYALILFGNSNFLLAAAFFLTGLARGAASNYCNSKINALAPGKAWIINGLHAMFSVGAFIFPILLTLITMSSDDRWVYACGFMMAVGVITWIMYLMIPEDEVKAASGEGKKKSVDFGFVREPLFYLVILTLFFYLCAEQGVIGWMITYFKDTGYLSPSVSQITASVQWIMMLLGRLSAAWLSTKIAKEKLLPVMGVGIVIFFVLLIMSRTTFWIMLGIVGFGYSMAGIYPTTVSFAGSILEKYPMSWSFILTTASFGSIIMPSIIGKIAETAGIAVGMSSVALVVAVDMVFIIVLCAYTAKRRDVQRNVQERG